MGRPIRKIIDSPLLTGHATFTDDIVLPGMLHAAILRSPYAHAVIERVNLEEALRLEGVVGVFTGEDVKDYALAKAIDIKPYEAYGAKNIDVYPLAIGKVRYAGEPVAVAVAESKRIAVKAIEAIQVDYTPLPVVMDVEKALEEDAPKVFDHWNGNLFYGRHFTKGNVDDAFKSADYVLRDTVKIHRHTGAALETRSYLASFDKALGSLTFYAATQQPHPLRTLLSATLHISESKIRVVQPSVGGAFGLKLPIFQEEALLPILSMKTGRPVKYTEDRSENFLAGGHARDQKHSFEVAFNKDGKIIGLRDSILSDAGVLYNTSGWAMPIITAIHIPAVYKIDNVDIDVKIAVTNKNELNAYRGFGKECTCFVLERMMDLIAKKLGIDRAEVRFRNFVQPNEFPYVVSSMATLDSGDYPGVLQKALHFFGYDEMLKAQSRARAEGKLYGIGIAYELTPEGACTPGSFNLAYDGATIKVAPSGEVTVLTGITSPGNGQETTIAQIVADELGVRIEDITVIQGDTALCPYGLGNFSGRAMVTGGPAAALAARDLRSKLQNVAAEMLEASPADMEMREGKLYVRGSPSIYLTLKEVSMFLYRYPYNMKTAIEPGLEVTRYFKMPNANHFPDKQGNMKIYTSFANAAHLCAVEVDKETGQVEILKYAIVDDCGKMINPLIVEGQLHGALVQAIGGTFLEELVYNEDGQLLTTTFMDYPIPTSLDVPEFAVEHHETPSPYTPLGAKGVGESGIVGAPACLVSAIEDALSPFNVKILETPLRPSKVWRLMREGKSDNSRT